MDGIVVIKNNCKEVTVGVADTSSTEAIAKSTGFADIYGRNGKATKGSFGTTNNELKGVLICGSLAAVSNTDMGNADNLYYKQFLAGPVENQVVATAEAYKAIPYNEDPIS